MSLHIEIGDLKKVSEDLISCPLGTNLMEALCFCKIDLPFVCAGAGTCGRCRIKLLEGEAPLTDAESRLLSAEDIEAGIRLACQVEVTGGLVIELLDDADMAVPKTYITQKEAAASYSFAIDIGTTTIAVAAVNDATGEVFDEYTGLNHERSYGADVISRILAALNGYGPRMRDLIINDIDTAIGAIVERNSLRVEGLNRIVIAGNTTMLHIFAGYSLEGLATAPFTPVTLELTKTDSGIMLPGISAFVGADIVAGMYDTGAFSGEDISLFIDLGTNGEMALGTKDRILVASTAAGPAFEGASLSSGTGSVPGAISDVHLSDEDDEEPITLTLIEGSDSITGICGSGIIALAAELRRNGLLSEEGRLDERLGGRLKLTEDGRIKVTQKDIRELQLAKAAIRAGIETLMFTYGITADEIDHVYLAGGFGQGVDVAKAAAIGLIPAELIDVTKAVGNTSLKGAVRFIREPDAQQKLSAIIAASGEVVLADNEYFSKAFMANMDFPKL